MKLTKRQLKRIIREEYSKLKRRGLIRESVMAASHSEMLSVAGLLSEADRASIEQGLMLGEDLGLINPNYPVKQSIKKDNRMFMEKTLEIWTFVTPSIEFIQMIHELKRANGFGGVGWSLNFLGEF